MLILSRRINESLVIADDIIVTVVHVFPESVELAIENASATDKPPVLLAVGASHELGPDVRVTLVEMRYSKARLGIDFPAGAAVYRKEVWDALGRPKGKGLPYPLPKTGRDPSAN